MPSDQGMWLLKTAADCARQQQEAVLRLGLWVPTPSTRAGAGAAQRFIQARTQCSASFESIHYCLAVCVRAKFAFPFTRRQWHRFGAEGFGTRSAPGLKFTGARRVARCQPIVHCGSLVADCFAAFESPWKCSSWRGQAQNPSTADTGHSCLPGPACTSSGRAHTAASRGGHPAARGPSLWHVPISQAPRC